MEVTVSMESLNANAEEMQRIKDERDALAAHVERLGGVLFDTFAAIEDGDISAIPYDAYRDLRNDEPTTSLARLKEAWKFDVLNELADKKKAEWQAEALKGAVAAMRRAGRQFLTEEELEAMADD